jgi:hypothetical protein
MTPCHPLHEHETEHGAMMSEFVGRSVNIGRGTTKIVRNDRRLITLGTTFPAIRGRVRCCSDIV